jgi:hypothetical protein
MCKERDETGHSIPQRMRSEWIVAYVMKLFELMLDRPVPRSAPTPIRPRLGRLEVPPLPNPSREKSSP